eukprot:IDg5875t1
MSRSDEAQRPRLPSISELLADICATTPTPLRRTCSIHVLLAAAAWLDGRAGVDAKHVPLPVRRRVEKRRRRRRTLDFSAITGAKGGGGDVSEELQGDGGVGR